jgi:hypothetical protein
MRKDRMQNTAYNIQRGNALQIFAAALFLFFNLTSDTSLALEVSKESAQLDFYGGDAGVYYLITDPQGRRVGYDSVTKQYVKEFPASFAFSLKGRDAISEKFHGDAIFNLIPGSYTIEVIGVGLTAFDVNIGISRGIMSEGIKGFDFEGVTDKGLISKFQFTYNPDPAQSAIIATRVTTPSSLKQDIILARKTGDIWRDENGDVIKAVKWIDNDGIMTSLLKKAETIEASIAKGNKTTAKNQLKAFINEVKAQSCESESEFAFDCTSGKHIIGKVVRTKPSYTKEGGKLVKLPDEEEVKAVKMLLEDAQYLMESLQK